MNDNYEALVKCAIKGEDDAIEQLFALGEKHSAERSHKEATAAFREAAIAYRIADYRNHLRANDAEHRIAMSNITQGLYKRWIKQNPSGMRKWPYKVAGVDYEYIRSLVVDESWGEKAFADVFRFLELRLEALGVEFSYPGNGFERFLCGMLVALFGCGISCGREYLEDTDVRIGADLVANEIEKRSLNREIPQQAD